MTPLVPESTVDNDLLDRYIAGECTPQDAQRVQRWLSDRPEMREIVGQLRVDDTLSHVTMDSAGQPTIDADWQRVWSSMNGMMSNNRSVGSAPVGTRPSEQHIDIDVVDVKPSVVKRIPFMRHFFPIATFVTAAVLLLLAGVGVLGPDSSTSRLSQVPRTFVTRAGERATVNLADGSHVMLGPLSTLTVTQEFGHQTRVLTLRGSGFFSVAQNATMPFIVDAGRARVEVLGTSFGVRSYPDEDEIMVAVRTGRVSITDTPTIIRGQRVSVPPLIASANDVARIDRSGSTVTRRGQEANDVLAWTEGRLVFRDVPLHVVLAELARWYDISFRLTDSTVGSLPITGGFSNQSIDELPDALNFILPVRVTHSGRVFTVAPRK